MISILVHEREIETLNKENKETVIKGSKNYFTCNVTFDDFWNDYEKTIVFKRTYGNQSFMILASGQSSRVVIPHEVLIESGNFKIGVFGVKDNITLPTLWSEEFTIVNGSDTSGEIPNPTPNVYEQILKELGDIKNSGGGSGSITIDQTYNPNSKNAQSGIAVAEALGTLNIPEIHEPDYLSYQFEEDYAVITGCNISVSGELVIPSTILGYPVKKIGYEAFYGCEEITDIIIPYGVTNIETHAFAGCKRLKKVIMPASVTYVDEKTFEGMDENLNIYYGGTPEQLEKFNEDWLKGRPNATVHCNASVGYVDEQIGNIETALDSIIAIQENLIGGGSV